jgi:hypothetical protein
MVLLILLSLPAVIPLLFTIVAPEMLSPDANPRSGRTDQTSTPRAVDPDLMAAESRAILTAGQSKVWRIESRWYPPTMSMRPTLVEHWVPSDELLRRRILTAPV